MFLLIFLISYEFDLLTTLPEGPVGVLGSEMILGDLNHNGLSDIIFWTNYPDSFALLYWEYTGNNNYVLKQVYKPYKYMAKPCGYGYLDLDNRLDMIVRGGWDYPEIAVLEAQSHYSYPDTIVGRYRFSEFKMSLLYLQDLDRDSRMEIHGASQGGDYDWRFVFENIGDNQCKLVWAETLKYSIVGYSAEVPTAFADFDRDGRMEFVTLTCLFGTTTDTNLIYFFENIGDNMYHVAKKETVLRFGENICDLCGGKDLDGNGYPEVYFSVSWISIIQGRVYFWLYMTQAVGEDDYVTVQLDSTVEDLCFPEYRSCIGDIDGDQLPELIWSTGTDVYVYKYKDGSYQRVWHLDNQQQHSSTNAMCNVYDLNNNGWNELVIGGSDKTLIYEIDTTSIYAEERKSGICHHSFLDPPCPNPTRDKVKIGFGLAEKSPVSIILYDPIGREVMKRDLGVLPLGYHQRELRLSVSSGVYFLRLETDRKTFQRKVVVGRR